MKKFQKELGSLINKYSLENGSNTPDFLIAEYLVNCLKAFNRAVQMTRPLVSPYSKTKQKKCPKKSNWKKELEKLFKNYDSVWYGSIDSIEKFEKFISQEINKARREEREIIEKELFRKERR